MHFASMGLGTLARSKSCGADTFQTLQSFGYTQEQLEDFKAHKVVFTEQEAL